MVVRRRELWLLLSLAVSLGAGLAVREFRAGFPDLSDRLEQLDREEPTSADTAAGAVSSHSTGWPSKPRGEGSAREAPGRAGDGARGTEGRAEGGSREGKVRAEDGSAPLDINRATAEELQRLPGIGPTLAAQIVRTRERRGSFASSEDLRAVPGIGPKKLDGIRDLITVGEGRARDGQN